MISSEATGDLDILYAFCLIRIRFLQSDAQAPSQSTGPSPLCLGFLAFHSLSIAVDVSCYVSTLQLQTRELAIRRWSFVPVQLARTPI